MLSVLSGVQQQSGATLNRKLEALFAGNKNDGLHMIRCVQVWILIH